MDVILSNARVYPAFVTYLTIAGGEKAAARSHRTDSFQFNSGYAVQEPISSTPALCSLINSHTLLPLSPIWSFFSTGNTEKFVRDMTKPVGRVSFLTLSGIYGGYLWVRSAGLAVAARTQHFRQLGVFTAAQNGQTKKHPRLTAWDAAIRSITVPTGIWREYLLGSK